MTVAVVTLIVALSGSIVALPIQLVMTAVGVSMFRTGGRWNLHAKHRKVCACLYIAAAVVAIVLQVVLAPWGGVEQTPWDDNGWYRSG